LPVPEILVKIVLEHISPPIFRNKKKFPFSSRISGTRKMTNFCFKEKFETRKRKKETWMDGSTDGRTNKREIDRQTDRQTDIDRQI
jgi:hypothetical protein